MTRKGLQPSVGWLAAAFLLAACGEQEGARKVEEYPQAARPTARSGSMVEDAAMDIVAFLQRNSRLDTLALADTVTLYVSPEGGGGRSTFKRSELREPSSWIVVSGPRSFSLVPPVGNTKLTTRPGKHLNCREYDLRSRYPELARFPHVGARLDPEQTASCLQTWNLTLVFDSAVEPRLIAAVYDQWEW